MSTGDIAYELRGGLGGGARSRVSDIGVIICNEGRMCARVGIEGIVVEK